MTTPTLSLLIIVLFAYTVQESHSLSLKSLNGRATENGEVPIYDFSSYVRVDLDYKPQPTEVVPKMQISLSNSETIFATNCLDYVKYNCSEHNCNVTENRKSFNYPFFSVNTAQVASADLFLDYSSWTLKSDAYLADDCYDKFHYRSESLGVIGLGTAGRASNSFIGSKIFSIYLNKKGSKLLFRYDKSLAASDDRVVFHTDANWKIPITPANASIKIGDTPLYLPNGRVIFDLHYRYIGIPLQTYDKMFKAFYEEYGIYCTFMYNEWTECNYKSKISDLPTFYLKIGEHTFKIPPEMYVDNQLAWTIQMGFRPLDPSQKYNWVTDEWKDTVILGNIFMREYYTVFDSTGDKNTISLYVVGPRSSYIIPIIITIAVVVILLGCYWVYKKRQTRSTVIITAATAKVVPVVQKTTITRALLVVEHTE